MSTMCWNTRLENGRWVPTFPKARYLFTRDDYGHFSAEHAKAPVPDFIDSVLPIVEAKRAEIVAGDHQIGDHVRLLPTPGHTPGHVAVCMGRNGDHAVMAGDLMHWPLQTIYPELSPRFDSRQEEVGANQTVLPRALLRHPDAVLHGAFSLTLGGAHHPPRQWVPLR